MVAVRRSTIIDADVDAVWRFLRDFNAHEAWHPAVAASRIEDGRGTDEVACVRAFRLEDGAAIFVYHPYNVGLLKPWVKGMPKNAAGDYVPTWNIFKRMYNYLEVEGH